jgi:hypothetical protein
MSQSSSQTHTTTNNVADSYNTTTNKTQNWENVGNVTIGFGDALKDPLPSASTLLPIALGLAGLAVAFLFLKK